MPKAHRAVTARRHAWHGPDLGTAFAFPASVPDLQHEVQELRHEVQRLAETLANAPPLRVADLMQRFGCSRSTVYGRYLADPTFPLPIGRGRAWRTADVAAWERAGR